MSVHLYLPDINGALTADAVADPVYKLPFNQFIACLKVLNVRNKLKQWMFMYVKHDSEMKVRRLVLVYSSSQRDYKIVSKLEQIGFLLDRKPNQIVSISLKRNWI